MKIYKVAVTEIYRKVVSVQAQSEQEAHQRAWDAWNNTEIILDMDDLRGFAFLTCNSVSIVHYSFL